MKYEIFKFTALREYCDIKPLFDAYSGNTTRRVVVTEYGVMVNGYEILGSSECALAADLAAKRYIKDLEKLLS